MLRALWVVSTTLALSLTHARPADRDNLTALLERIDGRSTADALEAIVGAESLGSLLQHGTGNGLLISQVIENISAKNPVSYGPPPEPNRRRNHTPCECPDNLGDSFTNECIRSRLTQFNTQYNAAMTVSATGDSVESGRLSLREMAANLDQHVTEAHASAIGIIFNVSDITQGYQASVDRMSQRILNEEYLMAQSMNSAWMNLIDVTTRAANEGFEVSNNTINTARSIVGYFNGQQKQEEDVTFKNLQRLVDLSNAQIKTIIAEINTVKSGVSSQFNQLETAIGGSEARTSSTADALDAAADRLSDNVEAFIQDIPLAGQNTHTKIAANLGAKLQAYSTAAQSAVSGYSTTGSGKKEAERKASDALILSQRSTASGVLTSSRSNLQTAMSGISAKETAFPDTSKKSFAVVISEIGLKSQQGQGVFLNKTAAVRSQLTSRDSQVSTVSDGIKTLLSDEGKKVTDSSTAATNVKQASTGVLNDLIADIGTKQNYIFTSAQAAGKASVDAIGTSYRASMDDMGSTYDESLNSLQSNGNSAAAAAAAATNSLASAAGTGANAVDAAQQVMTNNLRQAFMNVLDTVSTIPGGVSDAAAASVDMKAVLTTAKTDKAKAVDMIQTALFGGRTVSLDQQAATETAIKNLLAQVQEAAPSVRGLVDSVRSSVKAGNAAGTSTTGEARATGSSARKIVSKTAGSVATAEDAFANRLNTMLTHMITDPAGSGSAGAAVVNAASSASEALTDAITQIDDIGKKTVVAGQKVSDAIGRAQDEISASGQRALDGFGYSASTLGTNVDESAAAIDTFLSQASREASKAVADHYRTIDTAKELSVIQIGTLTGDTMESLRAVAANADALMNQINVFMAQNNPVLYKSVQELAPKAQGLFMRVEALRNQVGNIKNSINMGAPGKPTIEFEVNNLGTVLRSGNATSRNRMLKVGGDFNATADRISISSVDEVNAIVKESLQVTEGLKDELAKISQQTHDAEAALPNTSESRDATAKLQQVNSAIGNLTTTSQNQLMAIVNQGVGIKPSNMDQLYQNVTDFTLNAGNASAFALSTINQLSVLAGNNIDAANLFMRNEGAVSESEIDREASMAVLDENLAMSQLAERRATLAKLNQDSVGLLESYSDAANAQAAAQQELANTVYGTVVKARAETAALLGRMTQKYASQTSQLSTSLSLQQGGGTAQLSGMRNQLQLLLKLFDQYLTSTTTNFNRSDQDRDTLMDALLVHANNLLKSGDYELMDRSQELTDRVSSITRSLNDLSQADIDNKINEVGLSFLNWERSKKDTIAKEKVDISDLTKSFGFNNTAVQMKLTDAVTNVAKSAKKLLLKSGKSISGVDAALSNYKY